MIITATKPMIHPKVIFLRISSKLLLLFFTNFHHSRSYQKVIYHITLSYDFQYVTFMKTLDRFSYGRFTDFRIELFSLRINDFDILSPQEFDQILINHFYTPVKIIVFLFQFLSGFKRYFKVIYYREEFFY